MRIYEEKTYTMYLTVNEFELLYGICKEVGFGYTFEGNERDEDGEYKIAIRAGNLSDYLVRYVVDDTVHFKKIDFNKLNEQSL